MYRITPKGFEQLQGYLEAVEKDQLPFAASLTLNDVAFATREQLMSVAAKVFDRPKPQTVQNFFVRKATKTNLTATIWFDQIFDRSYDQYMIPEAEGGIRSMKPSEHKLGSFYVPGAGARMDAFGNMRGGQITQILSQLGLFAESGWVMNKKSGKRKDVRPASRNTEYFLVRTKHGGLVPGVYQRTQSSAGFGAKASRALPRGAFQKGKSSRAWQTGKGLGLEAPVIRGRGALPVMIFTPQAPKYVKRFPFYETAHKVAATWLQPMFSARVAQALATAKLKSGALR